MSESVTSRNKELPPPTAFKFFIVVLFAIGIALIDLTITQESGEVWSYLLPIGPILIFTIGLGLKRRIFGYCFALTYTATCAVWMIGGSFIGGREGEIAIFVGGAGLAMAASLFLLVWVIFWKLWRMVSSVKDTSGEVRPSEHL